MRAAVTTMLTLAAWAISAGAAHAAVVQVVSEPGPCDQVCSKFGGQPEPVRVLLVTDTGGEANRVTVVQRAEGWDVRDTGAAPAPSTGCAASGDHVSCGTVDRVRVNAGAGADTVTAVAALGVTINGGADADVLTGGRGPDRLDGGGGRGDRLVGGDGDDWLDDGDGGARGDADALDGGAGRDLVSYAARRVDIGVDLTRASVREGDALTAVEDVLAGSGDDAIRGDNASNQLEGGRGHDRLAGGRGADTLYGDGGRDELLGSRGPDALIGGSGVDRLASGPGDDAIGAHDGRADHVQCGDGRDVLSEDIPDPDSEYSDFPEPLFVGPDPIDRLGRGCERARVDFFDPDPEIADDLGTVPVMPRRVRSHTAVFANPCRGMCTRGRVVIRTAGGAFVGRAEFGREERQIRVPVIPGHWQQALRLRWVMRTTAIGRLRASLRVNAAR